MARLCLIVKPVDSPMYSTYVAQGDVIKARGCYRRGDVIDIIDAEKFLDEKTGKPRSTISRFVSQWFLLVDDLEDREESGRLLSLHKGVEVPLVKEGVPIIGKYAEEIRLRRRFHVVLDELPGAILTQVEKEKWAEVPSIKPYIRDRDADKRLSAMTELEIVQAKRDLDSNTLPRELTADR